ncbi:hypothetical protein KBY85_03145 [Cyanobium sp. BA5m-10]|uniref:hypothetical protein n=1 Tax=Cyanobium sp. BA5m-10 TaxID=2823705 RepID=UPI0020CCDBDA|nr:hypothetical protein [Cyanobium sp. BA5m-10]MCP9903138.1 hypothetical protein [Cyanobium sp. BA5m-10]
MRVTPYTYATAAILVIGALVALFPQAFAPTPPPAPVVTSPAPAATSTGPAPDSAIERIKKCARDLKVERQRWYFEETGMTTTIDSGAAQDYANLLEAQGTAPKRPLPFRLCE